MKLTIEVPEGEYCGGCDHLVIWSERCDYWGCSLWSDEESGACLKCTQCLEDSRNRKQGDEQ